MSPPVVVELFIDGAWMDITALGHVYSRDPIAIGHGRGDLAGAAEPSTLNLTLNNRDGRYSPRNPLSPLYGKIGRNTPIRVTVDGSSRFWGEVSSWPPRWDVSGSDAWVPIEAAGILRRIGQGTQPVSTGLRDFLEATSPITYWPLSDGTGSDRGLPAAGTYTGSSLHRAAGTAVFEFGVGDLASYLAPTLRINDTNPAAGIDSMRGFCIGSDATPDALAVDFVYRVDSEAIAAGMTVYPAGGYIVGLTLDSGSGTVDEWSLNFRHDGVNDDVQLDLTINDPDGSITTTDLGSSAPLTAVTDTAPTTPPTLHHVRILLAQDGADTDFTIYVDGVSVLSGTRSTYTLKRTHHLNVVYDRTSNTTDALLNFGHLIVWENAVNIPSVVTASGLAHGFAGETAGDRFERLCTEQGIAYGVVGLDDSLAMGLQYEDQFSAQLDEIETTDGGMLYDLRSGLGLTYRKRTSLYSQAPKVTLDYAAGHLVPPLEPVDDDRTTRNDVFAQRREGSSYRATLETGPLSVLDPPDGVGRYKDEQQVNVETDAMLPEVAGWLLGLGTVDEARWPMVTVNLTAPAIDTDLYFELLTVFIGDRIVITNLDDQNVHDDVSLLVVGYTETIGDTIHEITFNCAPYSPYQVVELDAAEARVDPGGGSTLSAGVTITAPSLSVASAGFLWTTAGADLPLSIMVGGEEMTVTAISGAASPQSFTVTRSVNGVVKTHSTGVEVALKQPGLVAL